MLDTLVQDLKYAARSLRRAPGITIAAILTLALGMGANATIFTLLDAVLFKPLPVPQPDELLTVYEAAPDAAPNAGPDIAGGTGRYLRFSYPRLQLLQQALGSAGTLAASTLSARFVGRIQDTATTAPINTQLVSGLYFSTLGVAVQRGRPLTDADMRTDEQGQVAVISDAYWRTAMGGSDRVVGQRIVLKNLQLTVVGIAGPGFVGIRTDSPADVWVPLTLQAPLAYAYNSSAYLGADRRLPWMNQDNIAWLDIVARVPKARQAQAAAALQTANVAGLRRMAESLPDPRERESTLKRSLVVSPFANGFSGLRAQYTDALLALAAMVAFVLLVTCANISNLLLARASGRGRETAIRTSLGATRTRLVRQQLVESLLLAAAGGVASVLTSYWTSAFLARAVSGRVGDLPPVFATDRRVWIFAAILSIGCAVAFGLVPALRAATGGPGNTLVVSQRVSTSTAMTGMRPLVAIQLGLSFAVILAAVLLGRTLAHFARVEPGFKPDHLIMAAIDPDTSGFSREQILPMVNRLVAEVDAVPGVVSSAVTTCGPITNCSYTSGFTVEDQRGVQINNNWVSPGYFSTVGIPVIAGRDFSPRDTEHSPRVAIVSESVARRYFPNQSPLGKRLGFEVLDTDIVGVVRDVRATLHSEPGPMIYFPTGQPPAFTASPHAVMVQVRGDATAALAPIRVAIQRAAPGLLLDRATPMSAAFARDVARERLIAYLAAAFACLALLLACVGLYGVLWYTVTRRTSEMGVRLALGARPADLTRMMMGDGSRIVLAGIVLGVFAAVIVARLVTRLLVGVTTFDPVTFAGVAVALGTVALGASYLPARRASRIDPATALRVE